MFQPCFAQAKTAHPSSVGYQSKNGMQENLHGLLKPIRFSATGIEDFLRTTFNDPSYTADILPNNFSHFIQFLEYGKKSKQKTSYAQSVLRLFLDKIKAAPYLNAHALDAALTRLPGLIGHYFAPYEYDIVDLLHVRVNNLLFAQFVNKFPLFKYDPCAFLDLVSYDIVSTSWREFSRFQDHNPQDLRKNLMTFLEVAMNKIIWSPYDSVQTWSHFKTMSNHLAGLHNALCITTNDLHDLYTSLLERYCFFIDVSAIDLSEDFFHAVRTDKSKNKLALFAQGTKERYRESNLARFDRALSCAHTRLRAYDRGLITR